MPSNKAKQDAGARPESTGVKRIFLSGRSVIVAMCVGQLGSLLPHVVVPSILAGFLIPLVATAAGRKVSPAVGGTVFILSNLPGLGLTACGAMFGTPHIWLAVVPGLLGGGIGFVLVSLIEERKSRVADREGPR